MSAILYALFVLSGAAGLIYESIWTRYLGLFVGHSAYAQVIVLAIFLGGMSLGAFAVGERSHRFAKPLAWYAAVEVGVGLLGLVFHPVFLGVTSLAYDHLYPAIGSPAVVSIVKWIIAALLILPQSILLGATFPLMSAGVVRLRRSQPGNVLAMLYFANSIGGAVGVLVAGFYLLAHGGLPGTLSTAAALNFIVALGAMLVVKAAERREVDTPPVGAEVAPEQPHDNVSRMLLAVAFGTAISSFCYEIGWIRMLSLVLGSATHSFELMLSAFILGISLGAFWIRRRIDGFADSMRALGIIQWAMGIAAILTLPLYIASFSWTHSLWGALQRTDEGYVLFVTAHYAFCLAVMLPATIFAGMTLPLITRMLITRGHGERSIGQVYAVNTLGSIIGVVLAGLVLMPLIGLKALLISGACIDLALGLWLLQRAPSRRSQVRRYTTLGVLAVTAILAVVTAARTEFARQILVSGVFRHGRLPSVPWHILFYKDGRTATVSVVQVGGEAQYSIATNGKPDASMDTANISAARGVAKPVRALTGDESTQTLLALVTLAHAPNAKLAAVIGEGSGMASHYLLGSPNLQGLWTVEIEPEMIRGSRKFYPANARVFDDPRAHFIVDDAKSYFAAAQRKYDIILSEPSNPWVSGVSGLFTSEFYHRVNAYLAPNGVFTQWMHLYEMNDDLLLDVLAALHGNFRDYAIYLTADYDIMIVATNAEHLPAPDWHVSQFPKLAYDLRYTYPFDTEMGGALWVADRATLAPLLDRWETPNSDYDPRLDIGAERARFIGKAAAGLLRANGDRFDVLSALAHHRVDFGTEAFAPAPMVPRERLLALSAVLRGGGLDNPPPQVYDAAKSAHQWQQLAMELRSGKPPADWRLWLADVFAADSILHGGTAGVADTTFFDQVRAYATKNVAPPAVLASVDFLRAVSLWDWPNAERNGDILFADAMRGDVWMPYDRLMFGLSVAKLELGKPGQAMAIFQNMERTGDIPRTDLRVRVLYAHIFDALEKRNAAKAQ